MRIALGIEYDGSAFHGWQRQAHAASVQAALETALARVADAPVSLQCAGRTDAGVHASHQVAHFDSPVARVPRAWVLGTNAHLPAGVAVLWARPVVEDFHARFSAERRTYRYVILNRPSRPALWHGRVTWERRALDAAAMAAAARHWLGEHDFSSFRAQGCQARHPRRTVHRFEVEASGGFVTLTVEANAFLQHMVRNFAGVLLDIGAGREAPGWARDVLERRDRARGGVTAPPDGLYLAGVHYPARFGLPAPRGEVCLPGYDGALEV